MVLEAVSCTRHFGCFSMLLSCLCEMGMLVPIECLHEDGEAQRTHLLPDFWPCPPKTSLSLGPAELREVCPQSDPEDSDPGACSDPRRRQMSSRVTYKEQRT